MARIRSLLATEALADPDAAEISEADVRRVARGIRDGKLREQVFPKLSGLTSDIQGVGLSVEVRMVKSGGLPVTYTKDPGVDVSAIRMVDLEKKFHLGRALPPCSGHGICGYAATGSVAGVRVLS